MKTIGRVNQATKKMYFLTINLVIVFVMCLSNTSYGNNIVLDADDVVTSYSNLPNNLRPAFENIPVWRLQLRVKTSGKKNANTDDEVYVKFTGKRSSKYFLDRAGDDREKNKVNTYDILDPNISSIRDIKFMHMMINGNDGWCVKSVELLINDIKTPVFTKKYKSCHWLDGNSDKGPSLYITGKELRKSSSWKYTSKNKAIWLPPMLIKRTTMEQMVESYIGHMMNDNKDMRNLEFGKKYGRAYVEAKKAGSNRLKFDIDLKYKVNNAPDPAVDVDFDLVVKCHNNKIQLKAESVKGQLNIPLATKIIRMFKSSFGKMDMGNFNFGSNNVPFCPTIKVKQNGDISIRP
jgi:hypothetical protein